MTCRMCGGCLVWLSRSHQECGYKKRHGTICTVAVSVGALLLSRCTDRACWLGMRERIHEAECGNGNRNVYHITRKLLGAGYLIATVTYVIVGISLFIQ